MREPWITDKTPAQVTEDICRPLEGKASPLWWAAFLPSLALLALGVAAVSYQMATGIGTFSAVSWPLNVGGKPFNSIPAFVPPLFEAGVLFAGLATVAALFVRSRLWPGKRSRLPRPAVTDDQFVVLLEERDAAFDPAAVREICERCGAVAVEERIENGGAR